MKQSEIKKRDAIIVEKLKQGFRFESIGKQFGLTRARIGQIADKYKIDKREINRTWRTNFLQKIKVFFKNGTSVETLMRQYNISLSTVYMWRRCCGMQLPNRNIRPEFSTRLSKGYVKIKCFGRWFWHSRWVIENKLGRKLKSTERVYHKNGNKQDNRISNLVIVDAEGWGK